MVYKKYIFIINYYKISTAFMKILFVFFLFLKWEKLLLILVTSHPKTLRYYL